MSARTRIEWTDATWNPVTGCSPLSPACDNCYARTMAHRLYKMGQPKYRNEFQVTCHPEALGEPLRWVKPKRIFVCSMGDLFHEDVPDDFIKMVFHYMNGSYQHTFQLLTKRPKRTLSWFAHYNGVKTPWPSNVWLGVTIEDAAHKWRMDDLRRIPALVRFVSFEPLLESVGELDLRGISWVIVGGETGPGARPMRAEWVEEIWRQTRAAEVAFFFKQWGSADRSHLPPGAKASEEELRERGECDAKEP